MTLALKRLGIISTVTIIYYLFFIANPLQWAITDLMTL